jgi:ABC-type spermidine/putrescine transport system permease subunit I
MPGRRQTERLSLGAPAALWLLILFIVPLFTMLSLSLSTCEHAGVQMTVELREFAT